MTTHMKLTLHGVNDGRDIAIINDTLPEPYDTGNPMGAEVSMGNLADGEYSVCVREGSHTADWFYRAALCNLAMWQYKLGEGARKEAATIARDKRRDELAYQIITRHDATYNNAIPAIKNAIDMIIDLEGNP